MTYFDKYYYLGVVGRSTSSGGGRCKSRGHFFGTLDSTFDSRIGYKTFGIFDSRIVSRIKAKIEGKIKGIKCTIKCTKGMTSRFTMASPRIRCFFLQH